jgi:thiamine biosynthesis lipoprotein
MISVARQILLRLARCNAGISTIAILGIVLVLIGCDSQIYRPKLLEFHGLTMGASYTVKLVNAPFALQAPKAEQAEQAIAAILDRLHAQMSTYDGNSEISRFNASQNIDWFPVSKDVCAIVAEALRVSSLTDGAFDITVSPLVNLWGFGPDTARTEPPAATAITSTMQRVGYQHLQARCNTPALRKDRSDVTIDLSAIAQGYGADRVADYLDGIGVQNYLVDVGGELRGKGVNASGQLWRIGIQRPTPDSYGEAERIVHIKDCAVATSGTYRNFFKKDGVHYSHTIDPKTGVPVTHNLVSVTIITPGAAIADALATALSVMGLERGYNLAVREALAVVFIVQEQGKLREKITPQAAKYLN